MKTPSNSTKRVELELELPKARAPRSRPSRRPGGLGIPREFKHRFDLAYRKALKRMRPDVEGHATHLRERAVRCGKKCGGCPHGVYFYERWRGEDGRVHERYLGSARGLG